MTTTQTETPTIKYSAYATEYMPGKWIPDATLTLGYDGSGEGRAFAWGTEIRVELRLTSGEDGTTRVRTGRITFASGGFDLEGARLHVALMSKAIAALSAIQNMMGEPLHGVGQPLTPIEAMRYSMAIQDIDPIAE